MGLKERLGKRIKELRVKNNLTQSKLAELVGIATKTQSSIETGRSYPSSVVAEKYAKVFKVDVAEVMNINHIKDSSNLYGDIIQMIKIMFK